MDGLFVQVRTTGAPQLSVPAVKNAIAELDKTLLVDVKTTVEATSVEFTLRRYATILLGAMGALGLLLAMIGLFGVLAWEVTRRTPEIGLRMALGASRRAVRTRVVRDALVLVGAGTVVGLGSRGRRDAPSARIPRRRQHGGSRGARRGCRRPSRGRRSGERIPAHRAAASIPLLRFGSGR